MSLLSAPDDYRKKGFLQTLERRLANDRGVLDLIWGGRFVAFLALSWYFLVYNPPDQPPLTALVSVTLAVFLVYVLGLAAFGLSRPPFFLGQGVRFLQVLFEISLYIVFCFFTGDPDTYLVYLTYMPLFVSVRLLGMRWTLVALAYTCLLLYAFMANVVDGSSQGILSSFIPPALLIVGMTLFYALRRRTPVHEDVHGEGSQLKPLLEAYDEDVYIVARDGCLTYVNENLRRKHGDAYLGQRCNAYFGCDAAPCYCRGGKSANAEDPRPVIGLEQVFTKTDGTRYQVQLSTTPLHDSLGQYVGTFTTVRDITQLKRSQQYLLHRWWTSAGQVDELTDERRRWIETYYEMGRRLAGFQDLEELLDFVAQETRARLQAETAAIFLLKGDRLVRQAEAGIPHLWFPEECYAIGEGITGRALVAALGDKYGQPVRENAVAASQEVIRNHLTRYEKELGSHQVQHLAVAPLNDAERSFGVLRVVNKMENGQLAGKGFGEEDVDFLVTIAAMAAVAIANTRLIGEIEQHVAELDRLYQVSQVVTASLDIDEVLQRIVDIAGEVVQSEFTGVLLIDEDSNFYKSVEDRTYSTSLHERCRENGTARQVLATAQSIIVHDTQALPQAHNPIINDQGYRSYAGVPIVARERVRGILYVHSRQPGTFDDQGDLLQTFSNQVANALDNAELYRRSELEAEMLRKLVEASQTLIKQTDREELYRFCADIGRRIFEVEDCSIYIINHAQQSVDMVASSTIPAHIWKRRVAYLDGPGLTPYVAKTGETLNFAESEYQKHPHWAGHHTEPFLEHLQYLPSGVCKSLLMGPVVASSGQYVGVLKLENRRGSDAGRRFTDFEVALHQTFASHIGTALERALLYEELDATARKRAEESLSQDLHEIMNLVHGTLVLRGGYARGLQEAGKHAEALTELDAMAKAARFTHERLRYLFRDVRSPVLQEQGLLPALASLADMLAQPILTMSNGRRLPPEIEHALFRIAQEALVNVAKHACLNPSQAPRVSLEVEKGSYKMVITDEGIGFEVDTFLNREDALGIQSMQRWADNIDAEITFQSQPERGTTITVVGPVMEEKAHARTGHRLDR